VSEGVRQAVKLTSGRVHLIRGFKSHVDFSSRALSASRLSGRGLPLWSDAGAWSATTCRVLSAGSECLKMSIEERYSCFGMRRSSIYTNT
jgi:hypothetical protein